MTAARMAADVRRPPTAGSTTPSPSATRAPVERGRPAHEPQNLGAGWVRFDYEKAFGRPVKIVNDAAMQALGSYQGGRMLFLGLGTGLGSALVAEGLLDAAGAGPPAVSRGPHLRRLRRHARARAPRAQEVDATRARASSRC